MSPRHDEILQRLEVKLDYALFRATKATSKGGPTQVERKIVEPVPAVRAWSPYQACDAITAMFDVRVQLCQDDEGSKAFGTVADLVRFSFLRSYQSSHVGQHRLAQFAAAVDGSSTLPAEWQVTSRLQLFLRLLNSRTLATFDRLVAFLATITSNNVDALLQLVAKERTYIAVLGGEAAWTRRLGDDEEFEPTGVSTTPLEEPLQSLLSQASSLRTLTLLAAVYNEVQRDPFDKSTSREEGKFSTDMTVYRPRELGGAMVDLDLLLSRICGCFLVEGQGESSMSLGAPRKGNNWVRPGSRHSASDRQRSSNRVLLSAEAILVRHESPAAANVARSLFKKVHKRATTATPVRAESRPSRPSTSPTSRLSQRDIILSQTSSVKLRERLDTAAAKFAHAAPSKAPEIEDKSPASSGLTFGCAYNLLYNAVGEATSFEEIRAVTFAVKCQRVVSVTFQLASGRRLALRCSATERIKHTRARLLSLLKEPPSSDLLLVSSSGHRVPDDAFTCSEVSHNNSTLWLLPAAIVGGSRARGQPFGLSALRSAVPGDSNGATMTMTATLRRTASAVIRGQDLGAGHAARRTPALAKLMPLAVPRRRATIDT